MSTPQRAKAGHGLASAADAGPPPWDNAHRRRPGARRPDRVKDGGTGRATPGPSIRLDKPIMGVDFVVIATSYGDITRFDLARTVLGRGLLLDHRLPGRRVDGRHRMPARRARVGPPPPGQGGHPPRQHPHPRGPHRRERGGPAGQPGGRDDRPPAGAARPARPAARAAATPLPARDVGNAAAVRCARGGRRRGDRDGAPPFPGCLHAGPFRRPPLPGRARRGMGVHRGPVRRRPRPRAARGRGRLGDRGVAAPGRSPGADPPLAWGGESAGGGGLRPAREGGLHRGAGRPDRRAAPPGPVRGGDRPRRVRRPHADRAGHPRALLPPRAGAFVPCAGRRTSDGVPPRRLPALDTHPNPARLGAVSSGLINSNGPATSASPSRRRGRMQCELERS